MSIRFSWSLIAIALMLFNSYAQQPELIWIGTLSGDESDARAVSSDGSVVVGAANDSNGNPRAFRWTAATGIQDLGTLGGDWSEATDVSADGSVIVGWSYDANGNGSSRSVSASLAQAVEKLLPRSNRLQHITAWR